jgi:phosphoribosyl-ATP pyrophosphohydrolase/phosphoribosyl-AMP cyclohydrolase
MIDPTTIDFTKDNGLVPCVVQDAHTLNVLMLGYMNREAVEKTLRENRVTFFSRSKNRLWTKGETSGNFLEVVSVQLDCDHDTLLIKAKPVGPVCHTGAATCFEDKNEGASLQFLTDIVADRYQNPKPGSYTTELFARGINKVAQKVGEEAVELVIEAKDNNTDLFLNEAADLLFHYVVLLQAKGHSLEEVVAILRMRHQGK